MLITVDVGYTLGTSAKPGPPMLLRELAAAPEFADEVDRNILHVSPAVTDEVKAVVCERLLIDPGHWPAEWPVGGFTAYPGTGAALARLAALGPVVALSNISVLSGPRRMADLRSQCGAHLAAVYTSYRLRARKPQLRCWTTVARDFGVHVGDIVHIGDRVPQDILGALHAGCRAAILTNTRGVPVEEAVRDDPRVTVVADLAAAADVLTGA